jgi:hypothetical protein
MFEKTLQQIASVQSGSAQSLKLLTLELRTMMAPDTNS